MRSPFASTAPYTYKPGDLFLGYDTDKAAPSGLREIGIGTEKHLITVAAPRTGKGAALIIPNLLRWNGSALVNDPKGENADATAEARANMGQDVGILDAYHECRNPAVARFRRSINPIALIDLGKRSSSLLVEKMADGLIRRFDPRHAQWDNAGCSIGAAFMAFIRLTAPPEDQHMGTFRKLLLQTPDELTATAEIMRGVDGLGGLCKSGAATILAGLSDPKTPEAGGLNRLREETRWMDDDPMREVLSTLPPFDLRGLKHGKATLYLVIPADSIMERAGFLRLFTRMALAVMADGLAAHPGDNPKDGGRCLFILDEFHALGKLDSVKIGCGLLPGFGVTLWPFLHNIGQLVELYGTDGAQTFFASSDAHIFFGNTDAESLTYVSNAIGNISLSELPEYRHEKHDEIMDAIRKNKPLPQATPAELQYERDRQADHRHWESANVGKPRIPADKIKEIVSKRPGFPTSRHMIVFGRGGDVMLIGLAPYFLPYSNFVSPSPPPPTTPTPPKRKWYQSPFVPPVAGLLVYALLLDAVPGDPAKALPPALLTAAVWWWWARRKKPV